MNSPWRIGSAVLAAVAVALPTIGALPAHGQVLCTTVQTVVVRQVTGGFTPSILDAWAFAFPPTRSALTATTFKQVVVCPRSVVAPSVVVVRPVTVAPPVPVISPVTPITVLPTDLGVLSTTVDPPAPAASPTAHSPAAAARPAAATGPAGAAPHDTVRDLAVHPERFDRQVVSVTGTVGGYEPGRTSTGAAYVLFELRSAGASVPVVAWGDPGLRPGVAVRVTGPFYAAAPFALASGDRIHGVLEAQVIASSASR